MLSDRHWSRHRKKPGIFPVFYFDAQTAICRRIGITNAFMADVVSICNLVYFINIQARLHFVAKILDFIYVSEEEK